MKKIGIYIVDDHEMVVNGLISMLDSEADIYVVGFALNAEDGLFFLKNNRAEVILVDINLPKMDGISLCKEILQQHPHTSVIALSSFDDASFVKQMVRGGAKGYLLKNTSGAELISAIRAVAKIGRAHV